MKIIIAALMATSVCLIKAKTYKQLDQSLTLPSTFVCHFIDGHKDKMTMDVSNIVLDKRKEVLSMEQTAWVLDHEKLKLSVDFMGEAHGYYINENDHEVSLQGLCTKKKSS